jgi:hypothetical protein
VTDKLPAFTVSSDPRSAATRASSRRCTRSAARTCPSHGSSYQRIIIGHCEPWLHTPAVHLRDSITFPLPLQIAPRHALSLPVRVPRSDLNEELLDDPDAHLAINAARTVFAFLDASLLSLKKSQLVAPLCV